MAGPQDFYVSFGSDASLFGGKLAKDLQSARTEINLFQADLAKLGEGKAGSNLARLLLGIRDAKGAGGGGGGGKPPATTGVSEGAHVDFAQMARDAAAYNTQMGDMLVQVGVLVEGLRRLGGAVSEEQRALTRSVANRKSFETQERHTAESAARAGLSPKGNPYKAGQVAAPGTGGRPASAPAAPALGTQRVTFASTPSVHVEEAAFKRVVDAVQKNVDATKTVRKSVDRLGDRLIEQLSALGNAGAGERGGGKRKEPEKRPAAKTPGDNVDPARDAAFTKVSQIQSQIKARERLNALTKLQSTLGAGEKPPAELLKAAAAGSGKFLTDYHAGDTSRIPKAIEALKQQLAGVPKMRQLQAQLADEIIKTGTDDGKRFGAYRQVAQERRQQTKDARAANPPAAKQARDTSVEAIRAERQESIKTLQALLPGFTGVRDALVAKGSDKTAIEAANANLKRVTDEIERLSKPLQREASAARKAENRAARKAAGPALGQVDVEQHLTDLALPGNPEMFREMIAKRDLTQQDLLRIAGTFTKQGYPTVGNTKTRVPQLTENILASREAFEQAGGQLAIPLNSTGKKVAPSIRRETRNFIARIFKELQLTVEEEAALDILAQNREGGGYVPPSVQNRRHARSQGEGDATRQPFQRNKPTQITYGTGFGDEEGRAKVQQAQATMDEHWASVSEAAVRKAGELVTRHPDFNPYDPRLRQGIQGDGPKADAANRALTSLTRGIAAWDARFDPAAHGAGSPIRAGIEMRRQARDTYLEQAKVNEEERQKQRFTSSTIRSSAIETMVGATTALGTGRSSRAFTRLYPGLTPTRNAQDIRLTDPASMSPEDFGRIRKAMNKYVTAFRAVATIGKDGDPEQLEKATFELKERLHHFIEAYEKSAGTTLPTFSEKANIPGYAPELGYTRSLRGYNLAQQQSAVQVDKDARSAAIAKSRREGPDEATLKLQAKNARDLARIIAGVSNDQGRFRDRKGRTVDVNETLASATARQKEIDAGKRVAPTEARAPELRRQFEVQTRPLVEKLQQQLDRSALNVERNQARVNAPDAELAGNARPRLQATIDKARAVLEKATSTDEQRERAQRSLTVAQRRLAQTESDLAGEERQHYRNLVERHAATGADTAGRLAALDPTVRDPEQAAKTATYLSQLSAQTARRNIAQEALDKAKEESAKAKQGKVTGDLAGRPVYEEEGKRLEQAVKRENEALAQLRTQRPGPGGQVTTDERLAGLQRAAQAYADQAKATYDAKRGVRPGGGGAEPPGTAGPVGPGKGKRPGGGDNDDDILRRILAELVQIHATLRTGVGIRSVGGRRTTAEVAAEANAPAATGRRAAAPTPESAAAQRQRLQDLKTYRQFLNDNGGPGGAAPTDQIPPELVGISLGRRKGRQLGGGSPARFMAELDRQIGALEQRLATVAEAARGGRRVAQTAADANRPKAAAARQAANDLSPAARAEYFAKLPDDLAAAVAYEDRLAAAIKLVNREWATQAQAVAVLRAEYKLTDEAAGKLGRDLAQSMRESNLSGSAQRGQERDAGIQRGQARVAQLHGGYDPALGYGTVNQWGKAADQAAASARGLSRATKGVQSTMELLSPATRAEVQTLQNFVRTGQDSTRIAAQQIVVYRQMAAELAAADKKTAEIRGRVSGVFANAGVPVRRNELDDVARNANFTPGSGTPSGPDVAGGAAGGRRGARQSGAQMGSDMAAGTAEGFSSGMIALFGGNGFASRVMHSVGTFLVRNFSAGLVFGITNAMQDAIKQGVETESTFVRVSQALEQTGRSSGGLRTKLQGLSEDYGVALKNVYTTAAGLTGLFDSSDTGNKRLVDLTRVAVQLELISGGTLSATEAMRSLASITSAYGEETPKHIADVATVIQNQLGVNIEETVEGVARLSGQAKIMGIDFAHAATYVASISKFTGQSGAASGEQFSRILESFQKGPTQKVVAQALLHPAKGGPVDIRGAFEARDYQTAIDALLGSYKNLSKAQQSQVSIAIGGSRQAAATNALLIEGDKVLQTTVIAYHSHNVAQQRAAEISKQLTAQLARARAAFVNFFAVLVRSGILDAFGAALQVIRFGLTAVNHTLSLMNDLVDSSPLTKSVAHWTMLIGGLVLGFNLARKAAAGLVGAINASAIGRATLGRGAATAGAAEGEAAAAGTAGAGGAAVAGQTGLLALLLGRRGGDGVRIRAGRNPLLYASSAGALGIGPDATPEQIRYRQMQAEALRSAPPGSSMLTPLGRASVAERFGEVDENGLPVGRRQRLFARQSVRLQRASSFLGDRAESLRGAAEARQLGGYPRELGYGDEVGAGLGSRALARVQLAGAGALQGGAFGTGKMSTLFAGMARNVNVASYAFAGIAVAAGVLITAYKHNKELADRLSQGFQQAFGAVEKQTQNPTRAQTASTYFGDLAKWNQNQYAPDGGSVMGALTSPTSIGLNLGLVGKSLFQGGITGFMGAFHRNAAAAAGVTTDDQDKKYFEKPLQDVIGFHGKAGRLDKLGDRVRAGVATIGDVDKAVAQNQKEITDTADKIMKSGASKAQKARMLQSLAQLQQQAESLQDSFRLSALGMNSLDTLTQDQLDAIAPMVQSIVSFGSNNSRMFAPLIKTYIDSIAGFDPGSTYQKDFDQLLNGRVKETKIQGKWTPINPDYANSPLAPGGSVYNEQVPKQAQTPVRTRTMTTDERRVIGLDALKTAATSAQTKIAGESEEWKKSEEGQKYITSGFQLATAYFQAVSANLQQIAANAQAVGDLARQQGNFGTAARSAAAQIAAVNAQVKNGDIGVAQGKLQIAQINDQAAQDSAAQATKGSEQAKLHTRNQIELAQIELKAARDAYNALKAKGGANYKTLLDAQTRIQQATNALADSQASYALASLTTQLDAATAPGDAVAQAHAKLTIAIAAQQDAARRFKVNSVEYQQATQGVIDAQRAVTQSIFDVAAANSALAIAYATSHGDSVRAARIALQDAQRKLREAITQAGGNLSASSVKQAQAQVVQAQTQYTDAINQMAEASANLLLAYANAAGQTVKAADLALADARRKLRLALRKSGGKHTAEVRQAQADVVTAQAAARDAALQDSLDTISFNQQMGYISAQSAIKQLQALLRERDLTKAQRRSIMLQIHGLQQDLVSSLTSSGFNIPGFGDLKLPSPYEVRRSLGVDKMQKALNDAVVNSDPGALSLTAMKAQTANSVTGTGSNTDLISAVRSVQTAIENRGSAKVSVSQQNHFNTPTAAVARQIAYQVIEIINQQTGAQARASTSTPRNVPTR